MRGPGDVCHRTHPAYTAILRAVAARWARGHLARVPASHDLVGDDFRSVRKAIDRVLVPTSA